MTIDAIINKFGRETTQSLLACKSQEELAQLLEQKGFSVDEQTCADILDTINILGGTLRPLSDEELSKVTGGSLI